MVTLQEVEARLARAGLHTRYWGRPEVRELCTILHEDEEVAEAVNGRYDGGFALLLATDRRVLLIDRKPHSLHVDDLNYEHIHHVEYLHQPLRAGTVVRTKYKQIHFQSIRRANLQRLTHLIQEQVQRLKSFKGAALSTPLQLTTDPTTGTMLPVDRFHLRGPLGHNPFVQPVAASPRRRVSRFYPTGF